MGRIYIAENKKKENLGLETYFKLYSSKTEQNTDFSPRCMNLLFGAHCSALLGEGLGPASRWHPRSCWLSNKDLTFSEEWMRDGVGGKVEGVGGGGGGGTEIGI